ncbi:MFS transporter, partial [archaeon]
SGIVEVSVMGSGVKGYAHLKSVFDDDTPLPPTRRTGGEESKAEDRLGVALGVPSEDSYDHIERGDPLIHAPNSPPNSIHTLLLYSNGADTHPSAPTLFRTIVYTFGQPDVFITTSLYGIIALAMMVYNEVFPLWVVTPPSKGGFALTSDKIGGVITVCGVGSILLQVLVYPWLAERSGVLMMFKMALVMLMVGSICTPLLSTLNPLQCSTCNYLALVFIQLLMIVSSNWAFVSLFVLISNSSYRSQRATVNSIGQTCASLGRLVGPVLGANVFAWSENNQQGWPLNFYLVFYLVCLCCVWSYVWVGKLPRSIERRKREPSNAEMWRG